MGKHTNKQIALKNIEKKQRIKKLRKNSKKIGHSEGSTMETFTRNDAKILNEIIETFYE